MFTIIGLMLTGMLLGYLLRKRNLSKIHKVITVLIWVLLFLEAVILTIGGTLGSVIAAWALWRALYKRKGGQA